MPTDSASAYAALGLEPGADAAAVEQAYKRLIKRYHPDREGGDAERAAEINRAYLQLRRSRTTGEKVIVTAPPATAARKAWVWASLAAVGAGVAAVVAIAPLSTAGQQSAAPEPRAAAPPAEQRAARTMDQPIDFVAVDAAIAEAAHLARTQDELALAGRSRECHRALRQDPSIARLDRCAAFDNAVIQLQNRDPLRDEGPFAELAVTGRQLSAATMLSNDYLAIDSRLRRIQLRVELALAAPPEDPPPAPAGGEEAAAD